eukprot:TRINITY_DN6057_c0_g3_i3.p1 TRINITY_DN6057_c0_g3~~TRINITY_DN6057_c0_g3_i3.p1  ORF type:complete len:500 (+),score=198.48 TRINITY_DN6057_c0_g3_i3:47-1501(+)
MECFFAVLIFIASVGGALFGYDTGVVSGAMIQIKSDRAEYPDVGGMDLTNIWQEAVVSITTLGAALGSVLCGYANEMYGRKKVNLAAGALFVGSCILMAATPDLTWLLVGRGLVGVAVGFAATTVPMYIAEIAPSDSRGKLITVNNVSIVGGQVLASLVACFIGGCKYHDGWRYMLAAGAIPGIILFVGFLFLPESPRWLVSKDKMEEARECLLKVRPAGTDVEPELKELYETVFNNAQEECSWTDIFKDRAIRKSLKLGSFLQVLQQMVGINTIMYYSATILQSSADDSGLGPWDKESITATCLSGAVSFAQMAGCIGGMFLIDRYGRKTLVLWSLTGCIVFLIALGGAFVTTINQAFPAIAMCSYLLSFGLGMSAIPWVFNAEIYPLHARAKCVAFATCVNWISSFIISFTFLSLSEAISTDRSDAKHHPDGAFWLYAVFGMIGYVYLKRNMPETRGLTLEEISELFKDPDEAPILGVQQNK